MGEKFEQHRFTSPTASDRRPQGWIPVLVEATFDSDAEAARALDRIRDVMGHVIRCGGGEWPSDEAWKQLLPWWLMERFHHLTREELEAFLAAGHARSELGWHYGSWLDAMHDRCWWWWDGVKRGSSLMCTILVDGIPYSAGAFRFLLISAGARNVDERFME